MSLQQVYSSPSGQFGRRLPATASVRAADELLRRLEPSTSDRKRSPYGESRFRSDRFSSLVVGLMPLEQFASIRSVD